MYVIDLTHFLNAKGAIAPVNGPARAMAEFVTAIVAHATGFYRCVNAPGPTCRASRKHKPHAVATAITDGDVVVWRCTACGDEGRISNWQGTFWDLRQGVAPT